MKEEELVQARARIEARIQAIVGGASAVPRLAEALTHPSFANESSAPDNQRLEFLGDAVLGLCVSELLARSHPGADEGTLTRMRSALVNAEALARWARAERVGETIALGKGARAGTEREQTNVLADAVEALVAAIYLHHGLEGARRLVEDVVREPMQEAERLGSRDPKSLLQEQVQARGKPAPTYRARGQRGPQHDPTFEVEVLVGDEIVGVGEGRSKRVAERAAALSALSALSAPNPADAPGGARTGDRALSDPTKTPESEGS